MNYLIYIFYFSSLHMINEILNLLEKEESEVIILNVGRFNYRNIVEDIVIYDIHGKNNTCIISYYTRNI